MIKKEVEGYPGYYACNDGQIWDERRQCYLKQCYRSIKQRRYLCVTMKKDGKFKVVNVHRLIAKAFIPNPFNLPEVNHKDEDPTNNAANNLEWCSRIYNNNYGSRNKRAGESQRNRKDVSKKVVQYDLNGNKIAEFPSAMEAHRQTQIGRSTICRVCNHKPRYHTAGGYVWRWAE